ncbi:MAG: DNA translocase FtsK [Anaerohalosphaeraceae bacterium]|nr:DNA translocase FtsK [Anaerohalosphaeraceae bacterium]
MKDRKLYIVALQCIALAVVAVLVCSCLSFDIADSPSRFAWPNNSPAQNWCGQVGAFFAYYLTYYIGPGVYIVLAAIAVGLIVKLAAIEISQPLLRSLGAVLLALAASASFYLLASRGKNSFPSGPGGIVGIGTTIFLKNHFSKLGTVIIIISVWIVGAILLADAMVMWLLHQAGSAIAKISGLCIPALSVARGQSQKLTEIWQKLNARTAEPTLAEMMAAEAAEDFTDEDDAPQSENVNHDHQMENHLADSAPAAKVVPATTPPEPQPYIPETFDDYNLPPVNMLMEPEKTFGSVQEKIIKAKSAALERVLHEFNIAANVVDAEPGPTITMFELALSAGVKVSQITNLSNDIARALGAAVVRVVAPLPGRHTIGIEVPNSQKETVRIKDLIQIAGPAPKKMHIPLFLGKDSSGNSLVSDLAAMPHLLIAGTTGSGKSVCINSIIMSIMLLKRPDEVKLVLIDPKMVEMTAFSQIPHLMSPIITDVNKAEQILEWATTKMDERYALLAEAGVKNIAGYNALGSEEIIRRFDPHSSEEEAKIPKKLPYFVIIVDELADLMMTSSKEIEAYIVRIAQKSRAVGIHIVLATQRPQATVVTGLIKSNLPSRISFRVASRMDSRIVLDHNGAETLLGHGDMLFLKPGTSDLVRAQGAFVDDIEVSRVVKHLTGQASPQFHPELMQLNKIDMGDGCKDDLFDNAVRIVLETKRGSVSLLQRKLSIGYARASRIIETMAVSGILGDYKGSQAREVMLTVGEWERLQAQNASDAAAGYKDLQDAPEPEEVEEGAEFAEDEYEEDEYEYEEEGEEEYEDDDQSQPQGSIEQKI